MAENDDRLRAAADRDAGDDRTRGTTFDHPRDPLEPISPVDPLAPPRDPLDPSARTAAYVERRDIEDRSESRRQHAMVGSKNVLDWLAIVLLVVGGLNWGLVGLFGIDMVAAIFGPGSPLSRVVYIAVGVAAVWGFALMRLGPTRVD